MAAILKIIAELLGFFLPLAKRRIEERDERSEQDEILAFQDRVTAEDDDDVNAMLHDWETRS